LGSAHLGDIVSKSIADSATIYNGKRYFIPVGYHYAGIFFNPKAMKTAGISEMPKTWDGLLAACKTLREHNIAPISLGSKSRWPAQFWFDYLLLGTAGPDYRNSLMRGDASFTDSQVKRAMGMWKGLVDADCFAPNSNAKEWTDAADEVARGEAAMTLMGTWITGYWNNNKLQPVQDYDFFPFPKLDDAVPVSVVGPVDGFLVAANSQNPQGARKLLAFMVSNVPLQANWAKVQGALSPNTKVDPSIYDPVMKKALDTVSTAQNFAFNYDLATPPPVAEVGLDMFAEFMNDSVMSTLCSNGPRRVRRRLSPNSRAFQQLTNQERTAFLGLTGIDPGTAMERREALWRVVLLAPVLAIFLFFVMWPLLDSFRYSVTDWNGFSPDYKFIGLANFAKIGSDPAFRGAIVNTTLWVIAALLLPTVLGLALALLLNAGICGAGVFKTIFYPHLPLGRGRRPKLDVDLPARLGLAEQRRRSADRNREFQFRMAREPLDGFVVGDRRLDLAADRPFHGDLPGGIDLHSPGHDRGGARGQCEPLAADAPYRPADAASSHRGCDRAFDHQRPQGLRHPLHHDRRRAVQIVEHARFLHVRGIVQRNTGWATAARFRSCCS
jgi:hypothetical protein